MAETPTTDTANAEPSMEEILASIRRIISDDKEPEPAEPEPEPLELTQEIKDDGSVVDVQFETPPPPPPPPPEPVAEAPPLVSEESATEAASALNALANTVEIEELASAPRSNTYIGNGSRTLEDMALELMRPLLRDWLDHNLPPIVDRLVQKEIERISRRAKD
jgi:cell pole-organizing protein PopZ